MEKVGQWPWWVSQGMGGAHLEFPALQGLRKEEGELETNLSYIIQGQHEVHSKTSS